MTCGVGCWGRDALRHGRHAKMASAPGKENYIRQNGSELDGIGIPPRTTQILRQYAVILRRREGMLHASRVEQDVKKDAKERASVTSPRTTAGDMRSWQKSPLSAARANHASQPMTATSSAMHTTALATQPTPDDRSRALRGSSTR
jgi:hypothetical protein